MAVTARTPWSQILNQFAEGLDAIPDQRSSAEILVLKSSLDAPASSGKRSPRKTSPRRRWRR